MLSDHLSEEDLTKLEEFKVPFNIIFFLFVFLTLPYVIQFNGHLHIYGIIDRLFLRRYGIWTTVYEVKFFWFTILHLNYNTEHTQKPLDSTQSKD